MSIMMQVISLFVMIILPIIVIGFLGLWSLNTAFEQETMALIEKRFAENAAAMDRGFQDTQEQLSAILDSARLRRIANAKDVMSNYERSVNGNVVRDLLTNLKRSSPMIHNVRVYLGERNIAYNAANYRQGSRQHVADAEYERVLALRGKGQGMLFDQDRLVMLRFMISSTLAVAEVEYDPRLVENYIKGYLAYEQAAFLLAFDSGACVLHNASDDALAAALLRYVTGEASGRTEHAGYVIFSCALPYTGGTLCQAVPKAVLNYASRNSSVYALLFTLIVFVCVALFFLGAYRLIHRPFKELLAGFEGLMNARFETRATAPSTDFDYLFHRFNAMAERLNELMEKEYTQQLLLQKAELKQLQAQINPHFLYNSFFLLRQMIDQGFHEESIAVSEELGRYFQYITRTQTDVVTLEEEYAHACIYCNIQGMRFKHRILIETDALPPACRAYRVPKLILQPLLENAFKYGMESKERGGLLTITFQEEADRLVVAVDDNGEHLDEATLDALREAMASIHGQSYDRETSGLLNICKRLAIFYGAPDVMRVNRSPLGGLQIQLFIRKEEGTHAPSADY